MHTTLSNFGVVLGVQVGDVAYVELFNDENGKPRGCGVVEFTNSEAMKKALFVMHRYELNGRKLVLKEETGTLVLSISFGKVFFRFYNHYKVISYKFQGMIGTD